MMQTDARLTLWICSNFTMQPRSQPGHDVNWSHLSLDDLKFFDIRKSVCTSYPPGKSAMKRVSSLPHDGHCSGR
jgi:hypothetical protein